MGLTSARVPRGIGGGGGSGTGGAPSAPPTALGNGSGGEGALRIGPLNFGPAASEISDVTTGRITLGMLAFYFWTRSSQGGG